MVQEPLSGESATTVCGVMLLLTGCTNSTEVAQLTVKSAIDHSLLRTMASETVDPLDWPLHPTLYRSGRYAKPIRVECSLSTTCTVQMGATNKRV